ncbi:hypothetical protein [Acidisoma cladoniae]|uniref:hypothetical protein n=1 Tax=Acidisoma cladoniae TaxID=3040935 RepID=UPI0025513C83|nr:hypothetical protein [Acidisoma sp. PAMC 29798]
MRSATTHWLMLFLGLSLIGIEGAVLGVSLFRPNVPPQYQAVYIERSQDCWLSPAEQLAAAQDPFLAGLPDAIDVTHLDHRTLCTLFPDWPPAPHRTADGGLFSRAGHVRIMLPIHAGQTAVSLTLEGYVPPRVAGDFGRAWIEVKPSVDGVLALPVTLRGGEVMRTTLALHPRATPWIAAITLEIPQPGWLHALNTSDDPQYIGVVLRQLDRS